jgi:hypothetical protein
MYNLGGSPATPLTDVAFNAGNFSSVGGSWTVAAGDVDTFQFTRLDRFIHLDIDLNGGTIAGNPSELLITLPASLTVPNTSICFLVIDPEGNPSGGFAVINQGTAVLRLRPLAGNWTNGVVPQALEISFSL